MILVFFCVAQMFLAPFAVKSFCLPRNLSFTTIEPFSGDDPDLPSPASLFQHLAKALIAAVAHGDHSHCAGGPLAWSAELGTLPLY